MKQRNVYSVGQINMYIRNMFAQDFMMNHVAVRGEVSDCKYHSSGHIYFTLKDETGVLKAIMFRTQAARGLPFHMKEGDRVVVIGAIRIYERDGKYQLYAEEISREGAGLLYQKFMETKRELEEMGMFAEEYKQPIPRFVSRVGVVTAPTGAAVRDIQNISHRRNPYVQVILYPALVQGEYAAASIVQGIHALEAKNVDVIIVGRGGGSMEDLWAFNEEIVARAIFECRILRLLIMWQTCVHRHLLRRRSWQYLKLTGCWICFRTVRSCLCGDCSSRLRKREVFCGNISYACRICIRKISYCKIGSILWIRKKLWNVKCRKFYDRSVTDWKCMRRDWKEFPH